MKASLLKNLSEIIPVIHYSTKENIITISHLNLIFVVYFLKQHIGCQCRLLSCISGVDLISSQYRFGVVYDFLSLLFNSRIRVKVFVNEITPVDSIITVFKNCD